MGNHQGLTPCSFLKKSWYSILRGNNSMREVWGKKRNRISLLVILGLLVLGTPLAIIASDHIWSSQAAEGTNITINYAQPLRTLNPLAIGGVDESEYGAPNVLVNDPLQQQRLQTLGAKYMRINLRYATAGNPASAIICGAQGCDTRWSGDAWIHAIKALGATPVVEDPTNPNDLPHLVKHFNIDTHNRVDRWLGGINEPNINGENATTYSIEFNATYDAMKAIDSSIKIGGPTLAWYDATFLQTFLNLSGNRVDFLDFHGYAQGNTTQLSYAALFTKSAKYETAINDLYQRIQRTVPKRASQISIEIGEWDLDDAGHLLEYTQFDTAWGAATLGHILRAGGIDLLYADKGNLLLKTGAEIPGGSMDEATPMYHALGMYTGEGLFRSFGSTMVQATTTLPGVDVYASNNAKNIVVVNESPGDTQIGKFQLEGVENGTVAIWGKNQSISITAPPQYMGILSIQNSLFSYVLPPFSVTTFVIDAPSRGTPVILKPLATATAGVTPTATAGGAPTATPTTAANTACVGDGVYIYQGTNYRGICEKFTSDVPQLRGSIIGSDRASSIKIVGHYSATLYVDSNYRGVFSVVTSDVPDLSRLAVGNTTLSSIRVRQI
ncbi:MAG TPA: hypothetical protein VGM01_09805 [Ktedonobacteraceae bacterium]